MNVQRGDVVKARFPHAAGGRGKKRPVVVVQADTYNQRLRHAVVAQVTGNLDAKHDPACLFIDATSAEAKAAGLDRDCLVCCTLLNLMSEDRLQGKDWEAHGKDARQFGQLPQGGSWHWLISAMTKEKRRDSQIGQWKANWSYRGTIM